MFNELKAKVSDFVHNPDVQQNAKVVAVYAAGLVVYAVAIGVVGGISEVTKQQIIKSTSK